MNTYESSTLKELNGLLIWQAPQLTDYGVFHFFTTRLGGVSRSPYHSLNLSFATQDDPYAIQENRSIVENAFETRLTKWANQVHGSKVFNIKKKLSLDAQIDEQEEIQADSLITSIPGVPLAMYFADCVPIFLHDPVQQVIALSHGGWRGTVQEVTKKTVKEMQSEYNSNPEDILAAIGPSIGPCCFEVKTDAIEQFKTTFHYWPQIVKQTKHQCTIDLWQANLLQLRETGILPENIFISQFCTSCNYDLFYSYRRDRGITGRMAALITIEEPIPNEE